MIRNYKLILSTLFLTAALFGASEDFQGNVTIDDKLAFSLTGRYTEKNGLATKTTDYFTSSGKRIISEKVRYKDSSFDLIDYTAHDSRTGRHEEIVRKDNNYVVRFQSNSKKKIEEKIFPGEENILHASNVAIFFLKNIDTILRQDQITFKLLVPERMMVVDFQIRHTGSKVVNGKDCHEFEMEPTLRVLKPLVKPIFMYYEKQAPNKIYAYTGPVLPRDKNGRQLVGIINFKYQSPS
ncbi:MAG: hypothetical protein PHW79_01040 [Candidatus Marinimicrobia bacterium]|jgi:hypothetical protein|nr:hypothetical protein [Candidatus Neomarinimicrobiota bacterium]